MRVRAVQHDLVGIQTRVLADALLDNLNDFACQSDQVAADDHDLLSMQFKRRRARLQRIAHGDRHPVEKRAEPAQTDTDTRRDVDLEKSSLQPAHFA